MGNSTSREPATTRGRGAGRRVAAFACALWALAALVAWPAVPDALAALHTPQGAAGAAVLLALGALSALLRAHEVESGVDLSFTAVVLLCAAVFLGPAGAALLGAVVSLGGTGGRVRAVNAGMTALVGAVGGWVYRAAGGPGIDVLAGAAGQGIVRGHATGTLLRLVAWPLVAADVAVVLANLAVLACLFRLSGGSARAAASGAFARNVLIYLAYSLIAFTFVVLWGPAQTGPVAAVLVVAPLLVARWAYRQDVIERRARVRMLEAVGAAAARRDGSPRRRARLRALADTLAAALGLPPGVRADLVRAADLHDLGMIAVPPELLAAGADGGAPAAGERAAGVAPETAAALVRHPAAGQEALAPLRFLGDVPVYVRHHHERVDGRGYPDGLAGAQIPLGARVLAVADVYEAAAWPEADDAPGRHAEGLAAVRAAAGDHLDPAIVGALERALGSPSGAAWLDDLDPDEPDVEDDADDRPALRHASAQTSAALARLGGRARVRPGAAAPGDAGPGGAVATFERRGEAGSWVAGRCDQAGADAPRRGSGPAPAARANDAAHATVGARARDSVPPSRREASWTPSRETGSRWREVGRHLLVLVASALVLALGIGWASRSEPLAHRELLLVFAVALLVAERFRVYPPTAPPTGYAAAAVGLGLALSPGPVGAYQPASPAEVLGIAAGAAGLDLARRGRAAWAGRGGLVADAGARWVALGIVAVLVRADVHGAPLLAQFRGRPGWWTAVVAAGIVAVALVFEWVLRAAWTAVTARIDAGAALRATWRECAAMGAATGATGVLVGIAQPTVGAASLPLITAPLVVAQMAVRRQGQVREAYRQSLLVLSRLPEIAGAVPAGHAEAVADVAGRIGRRVGLGGRPLDRLGEAALLHDIGQVGLSRPIPGGATVLAAPADQQRIASRGAAVAARAGADDALVAVVADQAVPYHEMLSGRRVLGLDARILKVANAFDDHRRRELAHPATGGAADEAEADRAERADRAALERLYLGYGHEFDPRVVDTLARLVEESEGGSDAADDVAPPLPEPAPGPAIVR